MKVLVELQIEHEFLYGYLICLKKPQNPEIGGVKNDHFHKTFSFQNLGDTSRISLNFNFIVKRSQMKVCVEFEIEDVFLYGYLICLKKPQNPEIGG